MSQTIGHIALNIAFVLYFIHYLPQLHHNRNPHKLREMSLHFHALLSLCYLSDLSYGFGMSMPWQYRLVSVIGTTCLFIQHRQLAQVHAQSKLFYTYSILLSMGLSFAIASILIPFEKSFYLAMGYLCQITAMTFLLPQIIKNYRCHSAQGLSFGYLGFNWLCYGCDVIAAYCLNWPGPSKFGAVFGLMCLTILFLQWLQWTNQFHKLSYKTS